VLVANRLGLRCLDYNRQKHCAPVRPSGALCSPPTIFAARCSVDIKREHKQFSNGTARRERDQPVRDQPVYKTGWQPVCSSIPPPFMVPMPLAWSDLVATRIMHVSPSPQPTPAPTNYAPAVGEVAPTAPDARKSKGHANRQSGGQSKGQAKGQSKRIKWTNKIVGELLHLRFSDGDVKRRLELVDTKIKKALAWQYFASVLSESFRMVLHHDQVSLKYRKFKCVYRKEKRELKKTGTSVRVSEMDD
ncbi:hypothetical protein JG688_00017417, partial [Phytophthora aleatoria]